MELDTIQLECSTVLHNRKTNFHILNRVLCSSSEDSYGASDYIQAQKVWLRQNITQERTIIISDFFNHIRFLRDTFKSTYIGGHIEQEVVNQAIKDYNSLHKPVLFVHSLAFESVYKDLEKAKHIYILCPQSSVRYLDLMSRLLEVRGKLHIFYAKTVAVSVWSAIQYVKRCAHFGYAKTSNTLHFMHRNECACDLAEASITFFHDNQSKESVRQTLTCNTSRNTLITQFISTIYATNSIVIVIVDSGTQSNQVQNLLRSYGITVFAYMRLDDGSKFAHTPNTGVYFMSIRSFYAAYTRIKWPVFITNPMLPQDMYNSQLFTTPGPSSFYYLVSKNCKLSLESYNTLSYLAEQFGAQTSDVFCD